MSASASVAAPSIAPRDVRIAVALFAAALIIRIVDFALQHARVTPIQPDGLPSLRSLVLGIVMTVGLLSLIIIGRNLGRIVFAVLTALAVLHSIPIVQAEIGVDAAGAVLSLLQMALQAAGLVFLFRPQSNRWFRQA